MLRTAVIMIAAILIIFAFIALVDPRLANDIINWITGAPGPGK